MTGVALVQEGPWTVGGLANHLWSVTGNDADGDISSTFLQPFVNYTTTDAPHRSSSTPKSTYDWENEQWSVPINFGVNQLIRVGGQRVQIGAGSARTRDRGPLDCLGAACAGSRHCGRRRAASAAELRRKLHMARPAELVDRLHPVEPEAARDEDRRIAGEAGRVAGDRGDAGEARRRRSRGSGPRRRRGADR